MTLNERKTIGNRKYLLLKKLETRTVVYRAQAAGAIASYRMKWMSGRVVQITSARTLRKNCAGPAAGGALLLDAECSRTPNAGGG